LKTFIAVVIAAAAAAFAFIEYRRWRLFNAVTSKTDPIANGSSEPNYTTSSNVPDGPPPTSGFATSNGGLAVSQPSVNGPSAEPAPSTAGAAHSPPAAPQVVTLTDIIKASYGAASSAGPSPLSGLVEPFTRLSCSPNFWNPPKSTVNGQPSCSPNVSNPPRTVCSTDGKTCKPRSL
jgi:hypothetical protein